jgi:hypothetical protein
MTGRFESSRGFTSSRQNAFAEDTSPSFVQWGGKRWSNPVGFSIEDGVPSMLYIGEKESPEPVPLSEIPFDPPLAGAAKLWLDSFERWKRERERAGSHER